MRLKERTLQTFIAITSAAVITGAAIMVPKAAITVSAAEGVNELTGLATSAPSTQRPVAIMIDNDKIASPHYGLGEADVVYEMINSTANKRVTRLMAIYKDWNTIPRIGNIRSTRPTNIMIASEYNAVLIHDGGPYYNKVYFKDTGLEHMSGGFARINNGKGRTYTEYVTAGEAAKRMASAGISSLYTAYQGPHFTFGTNTLTGAASGTKVSIPFPHNATKLNYNAATGTYDLYELGSAVKDAEDAQKVTFTNVILQDCSISKLDSHGYLVYNCVAQGWPGYYLTCGKAIPILWSKTSETGITKFYTTAGKEIIFNPGKTYIALVPQDSWSQVGIQ